MPEIRIQTLISWWQWKLSASSQVGLSHQIMHFIITLITTIKYHAAIQYKHISSTVYHDGHLQLSSMHPTVTTLSIIDHFLPLMRRHEVIIHYSLHPGSFGTYMINNVQAVFVCFIFCNMWWQMTMTIVLRKQVYIWYAMLSTVHILKHLVTLVISNVLCSWT